MRKQASRQDKAVADQVIGKTDYVAVEIVFRFSFCSAPRLRVGRSFHDVLDNVGLTLD